MKTNTLIYTGYATHTSHTDKFFHNPQRRQFLHKTDTKQEVQSKRYTAKARGTKQEVLSKRYKASGSKQEVYSKSKGYKAGGTKQEVQGKMFKARGTKQEVQTNGSILF